MQWKERGRYFKASVGHLFAFIENPDERDAEGCEWFIVGAPER